MGVRKQVLRVTSKIDGNQLINLTGMLFGHLLVKKKDITRSSNYSKIKMTRAYWLCKCDLCGCIVSIRSDQLRNGTSRMCRWCNADSKERFSKFVKELERKIMNAPEQQPKAPSMKRIKITKVPKGTLRRIVLQETYKGHNALVQVRPLRNAGTSMKDIAELLSITLEEVKEELARTR